MNEKLKVMKKTYEEIEIPAELDFVIKQAINKGRNETLKKSNNKKKLYTSMTAVAAVAAIVIGANTSQAFASSMAKVPLLGELVKVITVRDYTVNTENHKADIKVPKVTGLKDKTLENSLNQKYLAEGKKLYEDFKSDVKYTESIGGGQIGIKSGYKVLTNNDQILSMQIYAGSTVNNWVDTHFDTIDKKNNVLITLPSLFKNEEYITPISNYIIKQMEAQYKADDSNVYYLPGMTIGDIDGNQVPATDSGEEFKQIKKDQLFYINKDGKLVIAFNKYEVGPGAMGEPEFVIPTDIIKDYLVSDTYIH